MDSLPAPLPSPPEWSLLLGSAGRFFVWLAIAAFIASAAGWLFSARWPRLQRVGAWGFTAGCTALFVVFGILATLFVTNRLEFEYVWGHGDNANTVPYRIAGIWAGQQGSFLLWACCAGLFGLLAVRGAGVYRRWFTVVYAVFLGAIAGILSYETPFNLNRVEGQPVVPVDGVGLSPALQNYWVTIHPPTIFLGFGALTVLAAFAFAALASNRLDEWVVKVRPWAILSATLVGAGLCMGGFWAYETLGWGGFWMWDPVENVSFVPWMATIALIHGIIVQVTRRRWTITNLLLGGLPFLLFVYGTFLTRSGALSETSVHSFAQMDRLAHKLLLGFMIASTTGFLGLWVWRAFQFRKSGLEPDAPPRGFHREGFYRFGTVLLLVLAICTGIGMSVPLFMAIAGQQPRVVEEHVYHRALVWFFVPLMLAMAAGPLVAWRGMGAKEFAKRIYGVLCVTMILVGLSMVAVSLSPWTRGIGQGNNVNLLMGREIGLVPWVLFLAALCVAVVVANTWRITELVKRSKISTAAFLSHAGVALLMLGLIVSRGFERKEQFFVQDGRPGRGMGYLVTYQGATGDLFDRNNKLRFEMSDFAREAEIQHLEMRAENPTSTTTGAAEQARMKEQAAQLRKQLEADKTLASPGMYYIRQMDDKLQTMVWPDILRHPFHDIYFVVQAPVTDASEEIQAIPGQVVKMDRLRVTYLERTMEGHAGSNGTFFGAKLLVQDGEKSYEVHPKLELALHGTVEHPVELGEDFNLRLKGMDASNGGVTLQLQFAKAIFPVEIYFKPLTILVWIGTGLMMFAGFLSAWYRRPPTRRKDAGDALTIPELEPEVAGAR
ncbi:MAG TPA: cytochrome c biogenesis protein CcsA [Fimbriimonadaceae bacterium]|nr:cytochrome c biogenesis protein CcsA [Fimbriimonadaceae bacterium]